MGLALNYTDQYGENYPTSYWRVAAFNIDKETTKGLISFNGYETEAKAGIHQIGQKIYVITPELYHQYFLPTLINPAGINHINQAYAMALGILDTKGKSFFDGATNI